MAQRVGSVVGGCLLVALLVASASPTRAQSIPAPVVTPVVQTPLDSVAPAGDSEERPGDSKPPEQLTYQRKDSEGSRQLHYRLEPQQPLDVDTDAGDSRELQGAGAARAADDGMLTPYTLSPRVRSGQSWVRAVAGYDTAANSFRARSAAESAVTGFFAVRVEFEHGPAMGFKDRVGLGGRIQFLNQSKHGIDAGFGMFYQPNDFRGEGNIVGGLMLGRRFGRLGLFGSALFGSDPEGDDQDLDGRMSMLYRVSDNFDLGWDNRIRYVLSTDAKRFGTVNTDWELALEPTATISLGPLAILTEAGFSALQNSGPIGQLNDHRVVRTGAIAMAGAGGVF